MAGSKKDYWENMVLDIVTGQTNALGTSLTPWVALFTAAPSDGTNGTEVSGGAYARQNSATKWAAPSGGSVSTNADVAFPTATANWGTVVAMAICDHSATGNQIYWADLATNKVVNDQDTFKFSSGNLTLTET